MISASGIFPFAFDQEFTVRRLADRSEPSEPRQFSNPAIILFPARVAARLRPKLTVRDSATHLRDVLTSEA
jgi:hypothetical protein